MKLYCAGAGTFPTVTAMTGLFSGLDVFASYYDISGQNRNPPVLRQVRNHRPRSIVCDSGAHAYFSASGGAIKSASVVKLASKLPPPKEYVQGYAEFINEWLSTVDAFVEFDTVSLHGTKFQKWQRDCLLEAVRGDRSRLLPVYHACEPRAALRRIIAEFPYIALEGLRNKDITVKEYQAICLECYKRKVKVHIFASVDSKFLMQVPAYSTDSSSWSMIYRSGVFAKFTGRGLQTLHRTQIEKKFDVALGVATPLAKMTTARDTAFRYRQVFRKAFEQYEKFAQYLTDVWQARGIVWS